MAPTTPTWLRPTSITVPHAAPSVNIVMPVATAMSVAATTGVEERAAAISATPAIRYAAAPSAAPSDAQAVARREPIRDQPAQQIAGHADDERQAREDAEAGRRRTRAAASGRSAAR